MDTEFFPVNRESVPGLRGFGFPRCHVRVCLRRFGSFLDVSQGLEFRAESASLCGVRIVESLEYVVLSAVKTQFVSEPTERVVAVGRLVFQLKQVGYCVGCLVPEAVSLESVQFFLDIVRRGVVVSVVCEPGLLSARRVSYSLVYVGKVRAFVFLSVGDIVPVRGVLFGRRELFHIVTERVQFFCYLLIVLDGAVNRGVVLLVQGEIVFVLVETGLHILVGVEYVLELSVGDVVTALISIVEFLQLLLLNPGILFESVETEFVAEIRVSLFDELLPGSCGSVFRGLSALLVLLILFFDLLRFCLSILSCLIYKVLNVCHLFSL